MAFIPVSITESGSGTQQTEARDTEHSFPGHMGVVYEENIMTSLACNKAFPQQ